MLMSCLYSPSLRGFAPPWTRRSRSSCWWTSTWWWGVATVPTSFSSTALSLERSDTHPATWPKRTRDPWRFINNLTVLFAFQGDCWICMELMSTSLDKFYKYVYCALDDVIPEEILGKITLAVSRRSTLYPHIQFHSRHQQHLTKDHVYFLFQQTVKALNHLKENLKIIHRGELM